MILITCFELGQICDLSMVQGHGIRAGTRTMSSTTASDCKSGRCVKIVQLSAANPDFRFLHALMILTSKLMEHRAGLVKDVSQEECTGLDFRHFVKTGPEMDRDILILSNVSNFCIPLIENKNKWQTNHSSITQML